MSFSFIIFTVMALTQEIGLSIARPETRSGDRRALESPDDGNDFIGGMGRMARQGIPPSIRHSSPDDDLNDNLIPRRVPLDPRLPLPDDDEDPGPPSVRRVPLPPSSFRYVTESPIHRRPSFLPTPPPDFPTGLRTMRQHDGHFSGFPHSEHRDKHPDAPSDIVVRHDETMESDPLPDMMETQRLPFAPFRRASNPSVGDWISRWVFRPFLSPFGI